MERASFAGATRDELVRRPPGGPAERRAELAGLAAGCARAGADGRSLFLTEHAAVARRILVLLRLEGDRQVRVGVERVRRLGGGNVYRLEAGGPPPAGAPGRPVARRLVRTAAARRAFLRGLWLACGSLSRPAAEHHLEFRLRDAAQVELVRALLEREGLRPGLSLRRGLPVVYLKGAEAIVRLLGLIGASEALLRWEEAMVVRQVRGEVNRLVNAETANLNKAVEAGLRQAAAVRRLEEAGLLKWLPPLVRRLARLRLERPDLSLRELGASLRPPLDKSAVSRRMHRLERLAAQLGDPPGAGRGAAPAPPDPAADDTLQ
ncbi:MAG: DNA-binding protein WhiA [Bacillota bacterium]|nr:DNA-binding protein WhiA [Bacillota bacterium]